MEKVSTKEHDLKAIVWGLTILVSLVAVFGWGQNLQWQFSGITTYQVFPVLGLLAFSIMWSHYIASALRQYFKLEKSVLKSYFDFTSYAVLFAILLHPGLLVWQLWRDGIGLPPNSYLKYVGKSMHATVILGTISLVVFLVYEFHRVFAYKTWWKYVAHASDIAMFLIIIHALRLGTQLQHGWPRSIWYFYAISYLASLAYIYKNKRVKSNEPAHE